MGITENINKMLEIYIKILYLYIPIDYYSSSISILKSYVINDNNHDMASYSQKLPN